MSTPIRYFYRTEVEEDDEGSGIFTERIFTVAYIHNIDTGATQYGGTVFRHPAGDRTQVFRKSRHRSTAKARLEIRPVSLIIDADNYKDVETRIRQSIRDVGVSGKRNK